jgi:hypothetical protein
MNDLLYFYFITQLRYGQSLSLLFLLNYVTVSPCPFGTFKVVIIIIIIIIRQDRIKLALLTLWTFANRQGCLDTFNSRIILTFIVYYKKKYPLCKPNFHIFFTFYSLNRPLARLYFLQLDFFISWLIVALILCFCFWLYKFTKNTRVENLRTKFDTP